MNSVDKNNFIAPKKKAALTVNNLNYVVIMPVWGDHHTGLFLRFCVPFLLTDGNVGAFPNRRLRIIMMSTRADFVRMKKDANYRRLAGLVDLVETEIDDVIDLSIPHRAMTECYLNAVRTLNNPEDTVTIFPTPDSILSRDALRKIAVHMDAGWRGVMVCGLRITLETAGPLLDKFLARPGGAENISERELTAMVFKNLHPITLTCDVASDGFMVHWPSHVYWIALDRSWLIAHCFHLHPLAVRGVPAKIDINTTIDGDYLTGLGVGANQLYVCKDSDELFCVEISPEAKRMISPLGHFTKKALVRFSVSCNPLHRAFYSHAIRWRGLADPEIPESILHETEEMNAAVARGSKYEELRLALKQFIRRIPLVRFLNKCVIYAGVLVKRFWRWLRSLVRGASPAQPR
jgi:hypothetical protein